MNQALILVDLQNDFVVNGALAVPEGEQIIPLVNKLQMYFKYVIATQDWHPRGHGSFAENHPGLKPGDCIQLFGLPQTLWPVHCVQGTYGAKLVKNLTTSRLTKVFKKGVDASVDSYSGFFDNGQRRATGLEYFLKEKEIKEVYILGLALDYCVKYTVLDACQLGFKTFLIVDACRGVNINSEDSHHALQEMQLAGAQLIYSADIFKHFNVYSENGKSSL